MSHTDIFPGLLCLEHGTGPLPSCPPHEANGVPHLLERTGLGLQMSEATGIGWLPLGMEMEAPTLEWWVVQAII